MKTYAFVVSLLVISSSAAAAQDYPENALKYAVHGPGKNSIADVDEFFADKVAELTGSKVKIDIYYDRTLGKQQEMLPLISAGAVDFTTLETAQYGETPLIGFANALPMLHFDAAKLVALSRGLYETSEPIKAEMAAIGAKMIFVRHLPNYKLLCREPYKTIVDLKGKKLRSYGAYVPVMWQSVGANAVNVVASELYDSLSKGVFDCAYLPVFALKSYKLYEPAPYLIDLQLGMIEYGPVLVPTVVWDSWSPKFQEVVLEAGRQSEAFATKHIEESTGTEEEDMVKAGAIRVEFEDKEQFKALVPDMLQVWLDKQTAEGRGEPAKQIVDYVRKTYGS